MDIVFCIACVCKLIEGCDSCIFWNSELVWKLRRPQPSWEKNEFDSIKLWLPTMALSVCHNCDLSSIRESYHMSYTIRAFDKNRHGNCSVCLIERESISNRPRSANVADARYKHAMNVINDDNWTAPFVWMKAFCHSAARPMRWQW